MQRIEEQKIVGRKAELNRGVSWSELCSDLLGDIMGRLCVTYQARFHAVCKSWRHVCPINKSHAVFKSGGLESASVFSWLVRVVHKLNSTLEFRLYEPCHSIHDPISVHTISLSELDIPNPSSCPPYIRIFCKCNWLFISFTDREQGRCDQIHFILFSSLTKTLKQLPPCCLDSSLWHFEQSFSSDPESKDCVFLLLNTLSFRGKFTVATYRKDDENWTVRQFTKVQNFRVGICKTMYTGGKFYIVSPFGQVASYDLIKEEINFESLIIDDDSAGICYSGRYDLFEVKGELMYIIYKSDISCTKRFDRLNKLWIPASFLQDSAIIDNEKPNSVENMTASFNFGCLICSLESFALDHFSPNSFRYNFMSNFWYELGSFVWLKPPVIQ